MLNVSHFIPLNPLQENNWYLVRREMSVEDFNILLKILVEYLIGIYLELYDEELQITERLQYYFVMSCESLAFAFMLCTGLFSTNIRDVYGAMFLFNKNISKYCQTYHI